ncbi:MAG: NTP transferase domain-containing protein [Clostridia bacterium]|nr:NTP transferase domain-containing protein [Clostridia bacterium]
MNPTLVVLAAGMGSRFGGLKQISPLGPNGEIIIDYSLHDAYKAGFRDVVFVIKHEIYDTFKEVIGKKTEEYMNVSYAFQEIDMLPEGFTVPEGRVKPWGTAHAVICAAPYIKGNFGIINADDFYGEDCYRKLYNFLKNNEDGEKMNMCMVAYVLKNTLTENGDVSRGVCEVENSKLKKVTERTKIRKAADGNGEYLKEDGVTYEKLSGDTKVSMNVWGLTPNMIDYMKAGFAQFLTNMDKTNLKAEYYLPFAVDNAVQEGKGEVTVLESTDKWYGVTYAEDKQGVMDALKTMFEEGKYPKLR